MTIISAVGHTLTAGAGEGALDEEGEPVSAGMEKPSGPLAETLGISVTTGSILTLPPCLHAPGGTYVLAPQTTAPWLEDGYDFCIGNSNVRTRLLRWHPSRQ